MYVIVGLGNPGDKYARTRHNVGFDVVELLAGRLGLSFNKLKCKAKLAEGRIGSERVVLAQPQTFMNLSGESVVELMNWYKVEPDHLIVVYDDIDLEPGHVRFRPKGSAGTHNGMRSIIYLLGRDDFPRVRVGTGRAPQGWDLADWVLAPYRTPEERKVAYDGYLDACDVICELVERGADAANRLCAEKGKKYAPAKPIKEKPRAKYDFSAVAAHLKEKIDARDIAGAVCAVTVDGRTVYQNIQGVADLETGRKMSRDTMFRLASMTKPITGVAMMILKERALVDFDAPVETYLPEFAGMRVAVKDAEGRVTGTEPAKRSITVRDILTHSSGLGQGNAGWDQLIDALPDEDYTLEGIVKESAKAPLDFQPGTRSGYSAVAAMNLLARICEVVTGMSYPAFLSNEIFTPLGMTRMTYTPDERGWAQIAEVYAPGTLKKLEIGRRGYGGVRKIYPCGSAGLVGTLNDYLRFTLMLEGGGALNGVRILSEESVREMRTPQLPAEIPDQPEGCRWGLSMRVTTEVTEGQPLPEGCYGWGGAYGTHFWVDPENRVTAVCLIAREGGGSDIARQFERDVMAALPAVPVPLAAAGYHTI
ncbi:MAG: aminoacyl-tRNA hydrolase [Eubacteriales bacterium]|nr:aminoacyl-tRNA hydrolase [Eubacteriales bacterium]